MSLEPQGIRAEVNFPRPFETAAAFADVDLTENVRIGKRGEYAFSDQMIEAIDRVLTIRPGYRDGEAARIWHRVQNGVF